MASLPWGRHGCFYPSVCAVTNNVTSWVLRLLSLLNWRTIDFQGCASFRYIAQRSSCAHLSLLSRSFYSLGYHKVLRTVPQVPWVCSTLDECGQEPAQGACPRSQSWEMAELRLHFRRPQVVNKEAPRSALSTKDLGLHAAADTHTQDGHTQRESHPSQDVERGGFHQTEKGAWQLKGQQSQGQQVGGPAGGRPRELLPRLWPWS